MYSKVRVLLASLLKKFRKKCDETYYSKGDTLEFGLTNEEVGHIKMQDHRLEIEDYTTDVIVTISLLAGSSGSVAIQGNNVSFNDTTVKNLNVSGKVKSDLTPYEDMTYQLGSTSKAWKRIYLSASDPIKIRTTIPNPNKPSEFMSISPFDVDMANGSMSINYADELNYNAIKIYPNNIQFKSLDGNKLLDIQPSSVTMLPIYDDMGNRRDTVSIGTGTRLKLSTADSYIGTRDFNIIPGINETGEIQLSNYNRIKFGGMEGTRYDSVEEPIIEEIMMGYKPKNSEGKVIPFAIAKSGHVFYQGTELLELYKKSVLYDNSDYELIEVNLFVEQLPAIKNKKWYCITGLPDASNNPENTFITSYFPNMMTIDNDFDIIIDFSKFDYSQGGDYYYDIEFNVEVIKMQESVVNGINYLFANEYIKNSTTFGPDYFNITLKEPNHNGTLIRFVKIGKFLYVTDPYYEQ